jgi:hypothetical protein
MNLVSPQPPQVELPSNWRFRRRLQARKKHKLLVSNGGTVTWCKASRWRHSGLLTFLTPGTSLLPQLKWPNMSVQSTSRHRLRTNDEALEPQAAKSYSLYIDAFSKPMVGNFSKVLDV